MTAKEYSILIENQLRRVNSDMYGSSDQILNTPYEVIITALRHRVNNKELQKFQKTYQLIDKLSLQDLIDENFDIQSLINDIKEIINNNERDT